MGAVSAPMQDIQGRDASISPNATASVLQHEVILRRRIQHVEFSREPTFTGCTPVLGLVSESRSINIHKQELW